MGPVGLVLGALVALAAALAADVDSHDQSDVPIEVQPSDPALAKIVLVAGKPSHGPGEHEYFAGCALLAQLLRQSPGVFPVIARDGWPRNPRTFEHAKAVVFFMNGGGNHVLLRDDHAQVVQKLAEEGVGLAHLHFTVEYPRERGELPLRWMGGYYEKDYSINPLWRAVFKSLPEHAITRGVHPFDIIDEWYYDMRFPPEMKGVTPILMATPPDFTRKTTENKLHPGRPEIMAWAYERPGGGRSFSFTGLHFHHNWANADFRRLITNAVLWTARLDVPAGGAPVELDPADLHKHLDVKPAKKK